MTIFRQFRCIVYKFLVNRFFTPKLRSTKSRPSITFMSRINLGLWSLPFCKWRFFRKDRRKSRLGPPLSLRRDTSAILAALLRTTPLPSQSAAIAVYVNTEKIVLVFRFVQWFKMVVVEFRKKCRKEDSKANLWVFSKFWYDHRGLHKVNNSPSWTIFS